MNSATARRPVVRLDPLRRPRPTDLYAHRPQAWPPVEPGQHVVVHVGFGLSTVPADTADLARHLRPARSLRIAGRTTVACHTARALLVYLWRADDQGGVR